MERAFCLMRLFEISASPVTKIAQLLKRDCRYYLEENPDPIGKFPLYRGLGPTSKLFLKKEVHLTNRIPKDIPMSVHTILNDKFEHKFEYPYRNGLFATGAEEIALTYSKVNGVSYIIFPIGDFSFIWSPTIYDLYSELDGFSADEFDDEAEYREQIDKIVNSYKDEALLTAIQSSREIMIWCEAYYAIRANHPKLDELRAILYEII
jgi:hypothetical protein